MKNDYTQEPIAFLCTAIVVNEFDQLLFEETFLVGVPGGSEPESQSALEKKLEQIEKECSDRLRHSFYVSCHCPFPMPNEVMMQTLSADWLWKRYTELSRWTAMM